MNIQRFQIICSILILMIPYVFNIKCWVCHSDSDPKCADPFDNNTLPIKDCREVKRSHLFDGKQLIRCIEFEETPYELLIRKEERKPPQLKKATMCRKIRQKIHGNWRTIRDCAFLGSPGEGSGNEHQCLYRKGTYDIYLEYCTCNSKDGCNYQWKLESSLKLSLFSIIISAILFVYI